MLRHIVTRTRSYISSVDENGGVVSASQSPPEPEYAVGGANFGGKEANEPLRERFELLMQVRVMFVWGRGKEEHVIRDTSHVMHHTSHVTRHTSPSQVAAPFTSLPLSRDNVKAVKTAFISRNSEQVRHGPLTLQPTSGILSILIANRQGQAPGFRCRRRMRSGVL